MKRYVVGLIVMAALAFVSAAWADKPDAQRMDLDVVTPGAIDCVTYTLDEHLTGHIILRDFFTDGEFVMRVNNFALKHTISNPTTGESLTTPDVGADHFKIAKDGSATLAIIGIVARVVVPGQGIVAGEVGKVTLFFEFPGDVPDISFAGIHDGFGAIDAAFCAALAP